MKAYLMYKGRDFDYKIKLSTHQQEIIKDLELDTLVEILQMFMEILKLLRKVIDENAGLFKSEGFKNLFKMLQEELNDEYLMTVKTYLNELKFPNGILISAELGESNLGINYVLRCPKDRKYRWLKWAFTPSLYIHERDDSGLRDLTNRENRAINLAANAMAQSAEHVLSFFTMLKTELAFYVGCLNLYDNLAEKKASISFPQLKSLSQRNHTVKGLYDICLSLISENKVVSNDVNMDGKDLVIITGANQGGKSTFLRSIGQAQLMMQCGMFVAAEYFCANICNGMFTHYKREEDSTMKSGKLDEELARISSIAEELRENSMILFNESFAATNEREGSEIARQIVCALLEKRIKVYFVTHLYEFAHNFYEQKKDNVIFLRAERQSGGNRTFKINEGEPLPTSYGEDLYNRIFSS